MAHEILNQQYSDRVNVESQTISEARLVAISNSMKKPSPSQLSYLKSLLLLSNSSNIVELGSSCGLNALTAMECCQDSRYTILGGSKKNADITKKVLQDSNINMSKFRIISGTVPLLATRLSDNEYDAVIINYLSEDLFEIFTEALRICKPRGFILVFNALNGSKVSEPCERDSLTKDYRTLIAELFSNKLVKATLSPIGDGILTLIKNS